MMKPLHSYQTIPISVVEELVNDEADCNKEDRICSRENLQGVIILACHALLGRLLRQLPGDLHITATPSAAGQSTVLHMNCKCQSVIDRQKQRMHTVFLAERQLQDAIDSSAHCKLRCWCNASILAVSLCTGCAV